METYRGPTADDVWRQVYRAMMAMAGCQKVQESRGGATLELLHVALEIQYPQQRWIVSRQPAINPALGIAEVFWILAGGNDAPVLNYWFPDLPKFAGEGNTYPGAYGYRLRRQFGVDQIRRACDILSSDPTSRQVVLQLWDASSDLPHDDGRPRCKDIPCNVTALLKVREGRLEWTQILRSNDLHRGLPYNILQFTMLQEVMAGWLGIEIGSYYHWSDSLHVYVDDAAHFSCASPAELESNRDSLTIDIARGEVLVEELYRRTVELTKPEVTESRLEELIMIPEAPVGYQNLMRVLGSESARRRARQDQAVAVMEGCTNPQLVQAWSAWRERLQTVAPQHGVPGRMRSK